MWLAHSEVSHQGHFTVEKSAKTKQFIHENGPPFFFHEETTVPASTVDSNPKIVTSLQGASVQGIFMWAEQCYITI